WSASCPFWAWPRCSTESSRTRAHPCALFENPMNEIDQLPSPDSKSVQKRASEALQDLGAQLTDCDPATLEKCDLPTELLAAVQEYKRLPNKHGALRRQLQFIGKLMRKLDDETLARIHAQLHRNVDLEKKRFQQLEQLRDRLLEGD